MPSNTTPVKLLSILGLCALLTSCGGHKGTQGDLPNAPKPEWATGKSWTQREPDIVIFHGVVSIDVVLRPVLLNKILETKLKAEHSRLLSEELQSVLKKFPTQASGGKVDDRHIDTYEPVSMFTRQALERSVIEDVWTDPANGISYACGSLRISPEEIEGFIIKLLGP